MPRCSIIVPVYNRASLTRQCLTTLLAQSPESVDFEVIIVDDASSDMTQWLLASYGDQIRVVTHTTNAGFASSCNDGAAVASGEYLVFLNNDTIPRDGWLDALVRYSDSHPNAAVVGSKLLFLDETIQHAGVVICQDSNPHHLYAGFPSDHPAVNRSRRFQVVTAACILTRRDPFEQVGGFDVAFRNGYEDVDLCLRLRERGYEIHYCHESVLYHLGSVSREGRSQEEKRNLRLYRKRWAHRVEPDELQYYVEDGLLRVHNRVLYPVCFSISPLLAVVDGETYERGAVRLLNIRSRQVAELLKEVVRLTVHVQEVELRHAIQNFPELHQRRISHAAKKQAADGHGGLVGREIVEPRTAHPDEPAEEVETQSICESELRAMLLEAHDQLLRRDKDILGAIYDVQAKLTAVQHSLGEAIGAEAGGFVPSKYVGYHQLISRVLAVARTAVPLGATIIVVSGGDDQLLGLDGRQGWHFPQNEGGVYAGYHPADSAEAIVHLEALRAKGGDFLLIPRTSFWWLDYYVEFKRHLEEQYRVVVREEEVCIIFALRDLLGEPPGT